MVARAKTSGSPRRATKATKKTATPRKARGAAKTAEKKPTKKPTKKATKKVSPPFDGCAMARLSAVQFPQVIPSYLPIVSAISLLK